MFQYLTGNSFSQHKVAFISFADSSQVIACTQNTPARITNEVDSLFSTYRTDGFLCKGDSIQVLTTGWYTVHYDYSYSGANTDNYHTLPRVAGTILPNRGHTNRGMSASDPGVVACDFEYYFTANDWLSFWIENTANDNDPTFIEGNISIRYSGE